MIRRSFLAALGQLDDWRFLRVVLIGVALSAALLAGLSLGALQLSRHLIPGVLPLPAGGWAVAAAGWGVFAVMAVLSVFLMVPVAALFSGLMLEGVADAVEDRHYPHLPATRPGSAYESLIGALNFFGVLVAVNLLALVLYGWTGPLAPLAFWALNGYLLGREYFQTVAGRRLGKAEARALRRANRGTIWLAGTLMAAPLSIPGVNLLVPVLGVATFTHMFHALTGSGARR